jgi:hypothetical protein
MTHKKVKKRIKVNYELDILSEVQEVSLRTWQPFLETYE